MPNKAPHQCNYAGCKALTTTRCCPAHTKIQTQQEDRYRGSAQSRGYTSMWNKNSRQFLKANPLCDNCYKHHVLTPATVVHHIIDHKGDDTLFWDSTNNWMPLCKRCHDTKLRSR